MVVLFDLLPVLLRVVAVLPPLDLLVLVGGIPFLDLSLVDLPDLTPEAVWILDPIFLFLDGGFLPLPNLDLLVVDELPPVLFVQPRLLFSCLLPRFFQ